jgi:alpha/beta superfamily hydrolase
MPAERVRFAAGEIELEGLLEQPAGAEGRVPAMAVCHPHPLYGGDMYNDVVSVVSNAALDQGIATLRFNFRGVGGSGGEHAGGVGEREDAWAALDYLRGRPEVDRSRLVLAGYSFGAGVALNAGLAAGVKALVAVSVPPRMIDFTAMQGHDIPVLIVAGDRDEFAPADRLRQLAVAIGPQTTCTIVAGADHFWYVTQNALRAVVGDFIRANL